MIVLIGRDVNGGFSASEKKPVQLALGADRYEAIRRKNAFCVFIEMIIAFIYHKADTLNGKIIK